MWDFGRASFYAIAGTLIYLLVVVCVFALAEEMTSLLLYGVGYTLALPLFAIANFLKVFALALPNTPPILDLALQWIVFSGIVWIVLRLAIPRLPAGTQPVPYRLAIWLHALIVPFAVLALVAALIANFEA